MIIQKKIIELKSLFSQVKKKEELYKKIIELGSFLPPLDALYFEDNYLIEGCQSKTYLRSYFKDGKVFFQGTSDALISRGLLALLIQIYNGQEPAAIVKHDPSDFFKDLNLLQNFSYNRSNGLIQAHLKIKQEALKYLIKH